MTTPRVFIIRHGETDANRLGILQGQMDTLLNAHGEWQAARTAEALAESEGVVFARAYASDLRRVGKVCFC